MKQILFSGVCTALVTPFRGNEIDYQMLETLIDRQIDAGVKAIVIAGTTGEAPTLTVEEKRTLFRHAVRFTGGRCKIIAGTGSNCTKSAMELTQMAQDEGVDGVLVVSPYYNKATPEGLYRHYEAVCASTSLPVIAYNVPSRTGVDIPNEVYLKLWQIPNFAGGKECAGISKVLRLKAKNREIPVWCGNDDQIVPMLSAGANGVISVISNVYPVRIVKMVESALRGDYQTAIRIQQEITDQIDFLFCEVNPIPVKAVLNRMGFAVGSPRLPLTPLSRDKEAQISAIF